MNDDNATRMKFHRNKNLWRRKVKKVIEKADDMSQLHMQGKYISMGRLYETAREIAKAGERGLQLRSQMGDYRVKQRERIHESIAATCKLLESASKVCEQIADKQGTPLVDFPVFVSDLRTSSDVELGANDALKKLIEGVE